MRNFPSLPQLARDVLIAMMSKGQLIPVLLILLLGVMVLKMPSEDVSTLTFQILNRLVDWSLGGYVLAFLTSGGWYIHVRIQRQIHTAEMDRGSSEKTEVQKQILGNRAKSSEKQR